MVLCTGPSEKKMYTAETQVEPSRQVLVTISDRSVSITHQDLHGRSFMGRGLRGGDFPVSFGKKRYFRFRDAKWCDIFASEIIGPKLYL